MGIEMPQQSLLLLLLLFSTNVWYLQDDSIKWTYIVTWAL